LDASLELGHANLVGLLKLLGLALNLGKIIVDEGGLTVEGQLLLHLEHLIRQELVVNFQSEVFLVSDRKLTNTFGS
jgi:hypothetical protein